MVRASSAARTAKWRLNNPEKELAYRKSERCKQVCRDATARWRARNPKPKKAPPAPPTLDEQTEKLRRKRAAYMRSWDAKESGFLPCMDFPPPPNDSICFNCRKVAKLHMDHDHITGKYRGYLCINCNMGIGQLGDTIEGLERAISYLRGGFDG